MRSLVTTIRALLLLLLLGAPLPSLAADYADKAALDALFAELKAAPDADAAGKITDRIWKLWFSPNVPALASKLEQAGLASTIGDLQTSMTLLNQIVADYPDFAEGWNQRATLEYMIGDLSGSLSDIARTLALEPRHFGALSGRVMIELKQGRRDAARQDMIAGLAIHPYLSGRELFPELEVTHL